MKVLNRQQFLQLVSLHLGEETRVACEQQLAQNYDLLRTSAVKEQEGMPISAAPAVHFTSEASEGDYELDHEALK